MKNILLLFLIMILSNISSAQYKIDFGSEADGIDWQIVNDGVMGGLSEGEGLLSETTLRFKGLVSLENNGGFSSLRSPERAMDLSGFKIVEIRYKSTDYTIGFRLAQHRRYYLPNYTANLKPTNGEWAVATIVLESIDECILGRPTGNTMTSEQLANTIRLGFITREKRAGAFDFEVDYIVFK